MLDFDAIARQVLECGKMYREAQSQKDDATKQAMTVLAYDTMIAEFQQNIEICERFKEQHRKSGVRILTERLREKVNE